MKKTLMYIAMGLFLVVMPVIIAEPNLQERVMQSYIDQGFDEELSKRASLGNKSSQATISAELDRRAILEQQELEAKEIITLKEKSFNDKPFDTQVDIILDWVIIIGFFLIFGALPILFFFYLIIKFF